MDTNVADRPNTNTVSSVCQTLITSVQKTATDVTAFVRRCRSARVDLAPTMRELSELQMVLQLLGDHDREQGGKKGAIPEELQMHLQPILTNCISTVLRIYSVLRQHGSEEGEGHLKWSAQGQHDVRELENLLVVYRSVLGLVSDLVSILVSSGSLDSPGQSSAGGMTPSGLRLPDVLQELQGLRLSVLASQGNATLAGQHLALQVHLGHIIAYALTMAKSEDWEKAVKTMDEAQKRTMATTGKDDMRGSIPATAPLRRIATTNETGKGVGDNYIVLDKGFENFLVGEDGSRSTSLLFAPHTTPEPGSLMAGGPSTGMMIMDGAGLPGMSGTNTSLQPMLQSNSSSANSRKTIVRRASGQQQNTMLYTTEKEVAIPMTKGHEEVTEEALAFAQVPVHILGRLSLNLVGHVYTGTAVDNSTDPMPGNVSGSSDQTSYNQSLSTRNTEEGFFDDDAASTRTSDMGSLHDGDLQFSQLDLSKPPPATMNEPLPPSKTTLASKTSFGSQEMPGLEHVQEEPLSQQLLPPLPLPPASIPTSQSLPPPLPPPPSQQSLSAAPTPTPTIVYPVSYSESQQVPHAPPRIPQPYQHERIPSTSTTQSIVYGPHRPPPPPSGYGSHSLREMRSISTMNTHTFINMQKPLPRTPLVYIPAYPGPFVKTKAVVVGNFSCGKTCLITRMSRGHYPRSKQDKCSITENVRISIDDEPIELSLWDIRGIDYDPTWLKDAHVALVCFSVNIGSTDSKGKHLGRWVAEVNRNCPGASILLVGLKSDIRFHARSVEKLQSRGKGLVTPEQGAMFRDNIGASRYLECSARTGDGVLEVLGETARVAMQVKRAQQMRKNGGGNGAKRPLSRIGKFLGLGGKE